MKEPLEVLEPLLRRPLLTVEQERALGRQIRLGGVESREAFEKLVESNIGLVVSIVKKFRAGSLTEDLTAEGMLGLIRAAQLYDPNLGFRFSTYATLWIRQAISRAIESYCNARNVARLPVYLTDKLPSLNKLLDEHPELGTDIAQLQRRLKVRTSTTMEKLLVAHRGGFTALSLNSPLPSERGELGDLVPNPKIANNRSEIVELIMRCLTKREATILRWFYLEGLSLEQIATKLKIKRTSTYNIRVQAIRKIRKKYPNIASVLLEP